MRMGGALVIWVVLGAACPWGLFADEFPYQAYVSGSDVYVRSGPGKNYYPTDKLQRGTSIEVWRHDPGGWFAIRPPENSYSWIAAKNLKIGDDDLGEVIGDRAVAYVGSKFSDVRDVRQVELEEGELVEIVGEKRFTNPQEGLAETWYKIAPPRGEFRWVFGRFLVREGIPATTAQHAKTERRAGADVADRSSDKRPSRWGQPTVREIARNESPGASEPTEIPPQAKSTETIRLASASLPNDRDRATQRPRARGAASSHAATDVSDASIDELDRQLSLVIIRPAVEWDFDALRARVEALIDEAPTAVDRGRAKRVQAEIDRYEKLRQDYGSLDAIRAETDRKNRNVDAFVEAALTAEIAPEASRREPEPYDGIGRLTPVVSRRVGAPQFALTDVDGEVVMFVSPEAGVDFDSYVGKVVGLMGTRGFMPQLKTPHLRARRIEKLDGAARMARRP